MPQFSETLDGTVTITLDHDTKRIFFLNTVALGFEGNVTIDGSVIDSFDYAANNRMQSNFGLSYKIKNGDFKKGQIITYYNQFGCAIIA